MSFGSPLEEYVVDDAVVDQVAVLDRAHAAHATAVAAGDSDYEGVFPA